MLTPEQEHDRWRQIRAGLSAPRPKFRIVPQPAGAMPAPAASHAPAAIPLAVLSAIEERRAVCSTCDFNKGLTKFTVSCNCRPCRAKPLATIECPKNILPPMPGGKR